MIRASVSETKNRLSHFIRLVRGGEEVEIMDRDTPVARIVHVSRSSATNKNATWVMEAIRLGLIAPPRKKEFPPDFFDGSKLLPEGKAVLQGLLEERQEGR
jgi:antitoxin (DNA-binding transcriptional repressor) of toxin-antitoxin stability system